MTVKYYLFVRDGNPIGFTACYGTSIESAIQADWSLFGVNDGPIIAAENHEEAMKIYHLIK